MLTRTLLLLATLAPAPALAGGMPVFLWARQLPGGQVNAASHAETAAPIPLDRDLLVGSAAGAALYRVSQAGGDLVSSYPASGAVSAAPVVRGSLIYFGDAGGAVWCYEEGGALQWSYQTEAGILAPPLVTADHVVVTNVADEVITLNRADGSLSWRYQRKTELGRTAELALFAAPPAVESPEGVVVGFSDGSMVSLDEDTGERQWELLVGEGRYPDLVAPVSLFGSDVYASGYLEPLIAVDRATRAQRWRIDAGAANGALVSEDGVLYHPGTDGELRAVITLTGAIQWAWDSQTRGALTTPVLTEAGLLVGSSEGSLYLIDPATGEERWRFHEPMLLDGVSAAPAVVGDKIFFVTDGGSLIAMVTPQDRPDDGRGRGASHRR
ncbi:MAG: PQQ-binding-like beta-propeller repeat protein [Deltaproteobacteria bacterium]|nr:PQQ-binding-like beta-propeller repeat protein [Deltaproteobacteria bacterium]